MGDCCSDHAVFDYTAPTAYDFDRKQGDTVSHRDAQALVWRSDFVGFDQQFAHSATGGSKHSRYVDIDFECDGGHFCNRTLDCWACGAFQGCQKQ